MSVLRLDQGRGIPRGGPDPAGGDDDVTTLAPEALRYTRADACDSCGGPLTPRQALAGLPQTGPLVFPSMPGKVSDFFGRIAEGAGLKGVTFHCLRDTYISRIAPHVSTPTLMDLARHRDYRTTRRYVRVDEAHLRAAVERLAGPDCVHHSSLVQFSAPGNAGGREGER